MLSGPEKEAIKSKPASPDLRVGDDHRNAVLVGLPHHRDDRLAVGRPDDDRVDLLLDQVLHLRDLPGDVAAGVQHHGLDVRVGLRRLDEGLFVGGLIAVDADIVLRDADGHRLGGGGAGQAEGCQRRTCGKRGLEAERHESRLLPGMAVNGRVARRTGCAVIPSGRALDGDRARGGPVGPTERAASC